MDAATIKQQIIDRAQQPQSATVNDRSATNYSLDDLIAAHRYLRSLESVDDTTSDGLNTTLGVRMTKIQPGGSA